MRYRRMPIEVESPEQFGYERIRFNLAESSVRDARLGDLALDAQDLAGLVLAYGDHRGDPRLRTLIASASGAGAALGMDDVLVTPGAAAALFMVHTALLSSGGHVVVARPNYATNLETPRAIGADVSFLDLTWETAYRVDPKRLASLLRPETALVSLTSPHNPTGQVMDEAALREIVALIERHGRARLLLDETYREMTFGAAPPPAATLSDRAISVSSLSKTYGLPGIRVGWLATRDGTLMETLLAAKEQIVITNSVVDEELARRALAQREEWLLRIRAGIDQGFAATRNWLATQETFEWIEPMGGVVGFPRVRPALAVDVDRFYTLLFERYGAVVGPGHWFEQPRSHFRLGFGWPTLTELEGGLSSLSAAARDAQGG